jgi:streptogramin lyase
LAERHRRPQNRENSRTRTGNANRQIPAVNEQGTGHLRRKKPSTYIWTEFF